MKKKVGLIEKRNKSGYIFIAPFVIGFVAFFLMPIVQSIIFSFSKISFTPQGYISSFIGGSNYKNALFVNSEFNTKLLSSVKNMILNVPLIIIFSFFTATLLNQNFHGRTIARLIFFLPVIISSGAMINTDFYALLESSKTVASSGTTMLQDVSYASFNLKDLFESMNLPTTMMDYINTAIESLYNVVNMSGVQILIFLAALQNVSPALYEAAKIEGATSWSIFWKIVFPMVSPMIVVNVFYSIVDTFVRNDNDVIATIDKTFFTQLDIGVGSAMAWIYFAIVFIVLILFSSIVIRLTKNNRG